MSDTDDPLLAVANSEPPQSESTSWSKRRIIIFLVVIAGIASCTTAGVCSLFSGTSEEDKELQRFYGDHCDWDARWAITEQVKRSMNDPESFEYVEARITPVNEHGYHDYTMTFRGRNAFGGIVTARAEAIVDNEDCSAALVNIEQ